MESSFIVNDLLTRKEAARLAGVGERQFDRLRAWGIVQTITVGKSLRFRMEDVRKIGTSHLKHHRWQLDNLA